MKLAAIDIGSNSIKMVVVDATSSDSFKVIASEKVVVRLGHDTLLKGFIRKAAIIRAANCLKRFKATALAHGAERIITIATASVREANNAAIFIKEMEERTGLEVEVLSGIEEARLIGLAAAQASSKKAATKLNIDIGGGSTEVSVFRHNTPQKLLSLKLGAVGLTERFIKWDPPKRREVMALRNEIHAAFQRPARELCEFKWGAATGTSGTILALGLALSSKSRNKLIINRPLVFEPKDINFKELVKLNSALATMSIARLIKAGITPQRAEIIVAGGQILEGAMRALKIKTLKTCDWALREGVIIDSLREWEDPSRPEIPNVSNPKLRGVHALGKRFGYEQPHAFQVAKLAVQIFDALVVNRISSRHQRLLLTAAALLHDIGYHIAHESHHKHTYYLIENSELTGFSEAERRVIAHVARYHRGSIPKVHHFEFLELNPADRNTASKLAGILRIADALDRRHDGRVHDLICRRSPRTLKLELRSASECIDEIASAKKRVALLEEAFRLKVQFTWRRTRPTSKRSR